MTIKNETAFTKECMEGAMRACEAGNSRYKTFKLIYKLFGIIFAMVAGIMVFISLDELLPAAKEYGEHHLSIYGLILGMIVMAVSLLLFI